MSRSRSQRLGTDDNLRSRTSSSVDGRGYRRSSRGDGDYHGGRHHDGNYRHHDDHYNHHRDHHDYYDHHNWYLSYSYGTGIYFGLPYYYPYHHYYSGINYAFFYPATVSVAYVPYGFYHDVEPIYVEVPVSTNSGYDDVYEEPDYMVNMVAAGDAADMGEEVEDRQLLEPVPAAGSPTAEQFLRQASRSFHAGDYQEAAEGFRQADSIVPDNAAPLFGLGQSLIALGADAEAAQVLRRAILQEPGLLKEPGSLAGVYSNPAEFGRVLADLTMRAMASPPGSDARFLMAFQRYFSGDPAAHDDLRLYVAAVPSDAAAKLMLAAAQERFQPKAEMTVSAPETEAVGG